MALATMRTGERARLHISPEFAYGSKGSDDGKVPPDAGLVFEVWALDG